MVATIHVKTSSVEESMFSLKNKYGCCYLEEEGLRDGLFIHCEEQNTESLLG